MSKVTWVLHEEILERLTSHGQSLQNAIEHAGHNTKVVSWKEGDPIPKVDIGANVPVVLFGGHSFVKTINSDGRFQPGALGVNKRTEVSQYISNLPIDWFLNREGVFMTWAQFKQMGPLQHIFPHSNSIFARPNSGFKTFAGQMIHYDKWDHDIETLDKLSSVMNDTLIFISPPKDIEGEFRFVIADGKVITGSEYRWDGKLDIRTDYPMECFELAQKVAEHEWQVDIAYTCDIALTQKGPKVIELNGFSCAGLYAGNLIQIARQVSAVALKEFLGENL